MNPIFTKFVEKSPISVMARGVMEQVLNQQQLDEWCENIADKQYTRTLLFSTVFDIMVQVVSNTYSNVHTAYQASIGDIPVSIASLYNKLNGVETHVSSELVRYCAGSVTPIIKGLKGAMPPLLPGKNLKLLDGNCIEATEHRISELRNLAAGALPGKSIVVYDPAVGIPINVFLCKDGHAQERSMLGDVLETVEKNDVWVGDRNFCTVDFACGIDDKKAFFVFRQHGNLPYTLLKKEKYIGKIETGKVYEQSIMIVDKNGNEHKFRRIKVCLKKETRNGDKKIFIITNLSKRAASAKKIADIYRGRWKIETLFQELKKWFDSEINTLGYPPAALFAFCIALISYMIICVIKATLSSIHGVEKIDKELSGYYLADELSGVYRGMEIAIPNEYWLEFRDLSAKQLIRILKMLAKKVNLARFRKHPRGPKKPVPKRKSDPKHPHVSTARLIAARKSKN